MLAVASLSLFSCTRETTSTPTQTSAPTASVEATPVRKGSANASPSASKPEERHAKAPAAEASKLKEDLADLMGKISELKERANTVSSTRTRERLIQIASNLEEKRRAIAAQLENMDDWRTSASLAWSDMREGLERAVKELREAYEKAKTHF